MLWRWLGQHRPLHPEPRIVVRWYGVCVQGFRRVKINPPSESHTHGKAHTETLMIFHGPDPAQRAPAVSTQERAHNSKGHVVDCAILKDAFILFPLNTCQLKRTSMKKSDKNHFVMSSPNLASQLGSTKSEATPALHVSGRIPLNVQHLLDAQAGKNPRFARRAFCAFLADTKLLLKRTTEPVGLAELEVEKDLSRTK